MVYHIDTYDILKKVIGKFFGLSEVYESQEECHVVSLKIIRISNKRWKGNSNYKFHERFKLLKNCFITENVIPNALTDSGGNVSAPF